MSQDVSERQIRVSRILDSPIEISFEAWTKVEHLSKWWGPFGYTTKTDILNFKEGGNWTYQMSHKEHGNFLNFIKYVEIKRNEKIVYDHSETEDGPVLFRSCVTFENLGAKTRIQLLLEFPTKEACDAAKGHGEAGGKETLEKLNRYVSET